MKLLSNIYLELVKYDIANDQRYLLYCEFFAILYQRSLFGWGFPRVDSEANMSLNLLATKLYIPSTRKNLVERQPLLQRLNDAWLQNKKLVLVSAPAGYGKTTLVAEWIHSLPVKAAWYSLDDGDNDPARFITYLIAALQQIDHRLGKDSAAMLHSPQPLPAEVVLTSLINEISIVSEPFILVIDDYHIIKALPIHQQLDFLVEHQPALMHLVIITREDPPLPLARLRARGHMIEVRQNDLRFSSDECVTLLNRIMGFTLSSTDISALEQRTEGWIAGLQLAIISMLRQDDISGFIQAFTGSSHYVLDYLIDEVFKQQPSGIQDFLLKTSILGRLSGPLCDAVTGQTNSSDLLESMEHANLFIVPLDQTCSWYRYHLLFADLLKQRLRASSSISEIELHRCASRWFREQGYLPEAIQHALLAKEWDIATTLIRDIAVSMLGHGELITLISWLKGVPHDVIFKHPDLCQNYGWALTLTGRLDEANAYLQHAELIAANDQALLGPILVARAYHLRVSGDNSRAIEYATRALTILDKADSLSRSLAALTLGLAHWNDGNFQASEQAFLEVDWAAQQSGNQYARMIGLTYLGMIQAVFGQLHRAEELCQQVIQLGGRSPTVSSAHIELATLNYEWNKLDQALSEAQNGVEQSLQTGNPLLQNDAYRILAVIQQACGDPQAALSTLQKADQLADSHQVSPLGSMRIAACHVQIALAQRNLPSALYWAERVTAPMDSSLLFPCFGLTPARILLARNEKAEAAKILPGLYEVTVQKGCRSGLIEVLLLQALASESLEDALRYLRAALENAQSEGFIRTFVDKGEALKAMLARLKSQNTQFKPYILTILAAFGGEKPSPSIQPLVEPLSVRELEILRLLENGLSNNQIAAQLVIGIGTAKSHVHHILEKLGCINRSQAVAKARELKLL